MADKPVHIALTLVFQTPPSIAAAGAFGRIADRVVERNGWGQFIIPGSQVKGKVSHACEQLARAPLGDGVKRVGGWPASKTDGHR